MTDLGDRLKVAIVGCGGIGNSHARGYRASGSAELVGVTDVVGERAEDYAERYDTTAYAGLDALLTQADPAVVSIATPPGTHAELALQVLAAGKSVIVEKPPVLSLAELDRIAEAEQHSAGRAYGIFQHRHGSGGRRAHELLRTGALGDPLVAVCETLWFRPRSYFDPEWRGTWVGEGGGPTLGHGIHQIDLLLHLLGPWETLQATAVRRDRPVEFEDISMAMLTMENRCVATMINSLLSPQELSRIRIDSTGGTLEVNHLYGYSDADWKYHPAPDQTKAPTFGKDPGVRRADDDHDQSAEDPWTSSQAEDVPSGHSAQLGRLVDDLLAGRTHETTLDSTRPTMELITALYASALTGQSVKRSDLVPGHPFYTALNGGIDQSEIAAAFSI